MKSFFNFLLIPLIIFTCACTKDSGDTKFDEMIKRAKKDYKLLGECGITITQDMKLKAIPHDIGDLKGVSTFTLHNDMVTEIPQEIGKLKHLQMIEIRSKTITKLPESIGNLKNLRMLYLHMDNLTEIPESLQKCKELKWIIISSKKIKIIPNFFNEDRLIVDFEIRTENLEILFPEMPMLYVSVLKLYAPKIKRIPDNLMIKHVAELTTENLEMLPEKTSKELNVITVYSKKITSIQDTYFSSNIKRGVFVVPNLKAWPLKVNLPNVEELCLSSEKANRLPDNFRNLKKINKLILDMKELRVLPKEIFDLSTIESIGIYNIPIGNEIRYFKQLPKLQELTLFNNNISHIDNIQECVNLSSLAIINNNLKRIPDIFKAMKRLDKLDFSSNFITDYPSPNIFQKRLSILNLSNNKLTTFPFELINSKIFNFSRIILHSNTIDISESNLPSSSVRLRAIDLSNNGIEKIPDGFLESLNVSRLYLTSNKISSLPLLSNEITISELGLADNQLTEVPLEFVNKFYHDRESVSLDFRLNRITKYPKKFVLSHNDIENTRKGFRISFIFRDQNVALFLDGNPINNYEATTDLIALKKEIINMYFHGKYFPGISVDGFTGRYLGQMKENIIEE